MCTPSSPHPTLSSHNFERLILLLACFFYFRLLVSNSLLSLTPYGARCGMAYELLYTTRSQCHLFSQFSPSYFSNNFLTTFAAWFSVSSSSRKFSYLLETLNYTYCYDDYKILFHKLFGTCRQFN